MPRVAAADRLTVIGSRTPPARISTDDYTALGKGRGTKDRGRRASMPVIGPALTGSPRLGTPRTPINARTRLLNARSVRKWQQVPLILALPLSLLLQGCVAGIASIATSQPDAATRPTADWVIIGFTIAFEVIQICMTMAMVYACSRLIRLQRVTFSDISSTYLSVIVAFGGFYWSCNQLQGPEAFFLGSKYVSAHSEVDRLLTMIYFSTITMTTCGFGDIAPASTLTMVVVSTQMLANIIFQIGIFAFAVYHFHTQVHLEFRETLSMGRGQNTRRGLWWFIKWVRVHVPCIEKSRKLLKRHQLLATVFLQLLMFGLTLLSLYNIKGEVWEITVNMNSKRETYGKAFIAIISFQGLQCVLTLLFSVRLVHKAEVHAPLQLRDLFHSYVSACLTFGGLYFTIFVVSPGEFHVAAITQGYETFPTLSALAGAYYFSVTTMSCTGFGDVYPLSFFPRICVIIQAMFSIGFNILIFGVGTSRFMDNLENRGRYDIAVTPTPSSISDTPTEEPSHLNLNDDDPLDIASRERRNSLSEFNKESQPWSVTAAAPYGSLSTSL